MTRTPHILLIEDEWLIGETLAEMLRDYGATCFLVATVAEAKNALALQAFDGLITDWRFPLEKGQPPNDNAGALLLQWLAMHHPRLPYIVHSGSMFGQLISIAKAYGLTLHPDDVFGKGAPVKTMYERLTQVCGAA